MGTNDLEDRIRFASGIVWLAASLLAALGALAFLGPTAAVNDDYMFATGGLAFAALVCGIMAQIRFDKARGHP